jgi:hypothetical protein
MQATPISMKKQPPIIVGWYAPAIHSMIQSALRLPAIFFGTTFNLTPGFKVQQWVWFQVFECSSRRLFEAL